jgi:hypothetical protein
MELVEHFRGGTFRRRRGRLARRALIRHRRRRERRLVVELLGHCLQLADLEPDVPRL